MLKVQIDRQFKLGKCSGFFSLLGKTLTEAIVRPALELAGICSMLGDNGRTREGLVEVIDYFREVPVGLRIACFLGRDTDQFLGTPGSSDTGWSGIRALPFYGDRESHRWHTDQRKEEP